MTWTVAAFALLFLLGLATAAVARGGALDRMIGLQLANVIAVLAAITLALATGRTLILEIALVLAVLGLIGGLAYARFLERWL